MSYLARPISYVLVIILGYALKRVGFLEKRDQQTLSKVMFNITLPCTIIQGFSGFERDTSLFWLVGIGFVCALLPMLLILPRRSLMPEIWTIRWQMPDGILIGRSNGSAPLIRKLQKLSETAVRLSTKTVVRCAVNSVQSEA